MDKQFKMGSPKMRAQVAGYTFEYSGTNGVVEGMLPAGVAFDLYVSDEANWPVKFRIFVAAPAPNYGAPVSVFSPAYVAYYFSLAGQVVDASKGSVTVAIAPAVAGAGGVLSQPSDPGVISNSWQVIVGNTLLADSNAIVSFANVEPGRFTLAPIAPAGYACTALPYADAYTAEPMTMTWITLYCGAVSSP